MKKILFSIALIASGLVASAQVGVGTENPQTSLHIVGANATDKGTNGANVPGALAATDGITVPVVTNDMTLAVPGDLVAGTKVGQMVYSNFAGKQGFYYWDGTTWSKVGASAAPAFTVRLLQAASTSYDWSTFYNYFEFTSGTQLTLPLPSSALYTGKSIHVRNRTGGNLGFQGTDGVGTPRGIASISATSSIQIYSDGSIWHLISGRN